METGHTYHPVRSQCGRHAPHWRTRQVHNSLKDKVLSDGPTRARCDVGGSLVSTTTRAAPSAPARPGGSLHWSPPPPPRPSHQARATLRVEPVVRMRRAVVGGGGDASARPTERRSAALRPRALPESCSQLPPHRATGWKHGARGVGRGACARAERTTARLSSAGTVRTLRRVRSHWPFGRIGTPPLMRRPAWLSARSARRPTQRGGVRGSGTTRGRVRRRNPRASSAPRTARCESRFAAPSETTGGRPLKKGAEDASLHRRPKAL